MPERRPPTATRYDNAEGHFRQNVTDGWAVAHPQSRISETAVTFARSEGLVPAPEPARAIRAVIDKPFKARVEEKKRVILFLT